MVQGNPEISKAKWTAEEDAKLRDLVLENGSSWAQISRQLPGRTDQQCMASFHQQTSAHLSFHFLFQSDFSGFSSFHSPPHELHDVMPDLSRRSAS